MNIHTAIFEHLTSEELSAWSEIQRSEPLLASPYFRPEFTEAVASVRNDVEIAVLRDGNRPIGFLPFQRSRRNIGYPVGSSVSDFHGLIAPSYVACDPLGLLRACRLRAWHFDHLISDERCFSPFVCRLVDSPYIDLSSGLDAYLARREHGSHIMSEYGQKMRKLEREIGPLHFEHHVPSRAVLSTLLTWKSDQIRRRRVPNIFDYTWVRKLLGKIFEYSSPDFSAFMSVVYAGNKIAAIDFGMRSRSVLHSWFPAFNVELARYSPGLLCWIETMKSAGDLGICRIDFGKGTEPFKYRLMSGVTKVAEGTADLRQGTAMMRRAFWSTRNLIRRSPLAMPARIMSQNIRRVRHWLDAKISNAGSYS